MLAVSVAAVAPARAGGARDRPDDKSGGTATALAIGGTLGGFGLMALGGQLESEPLAYAGLGVFVVGPAAGHFYAGEATHGLVTSGVRAAGIATFAVGFDMSFCIFECEPTDERRTGEALAFVGLGIYAAATLYDVIDAHQAADRANRRAAARALPAPVVLATPDGHRVPGLALAGRF